MNDKNFFVHPSGYVDDHVTVGDGTKIWHACHVQTGGLLGWMCECGRRLLDETFKCLCGREYLLDGEHLKRKH